MDGPSHYQRAQELVDTASNTSSSHAPNARLAYAALAQVHATLALAAATVRAGRVHTADGWDEVLT